MSHAITTTFHPNDMVLVTVAGAETRRITVLSHVVAKAMTNHSVVETNFTAVREDRAVTTPALRSAVRYYTGC